MGIFTKAPFLLEARKHGYKERAIDMESEIKYIFKTLLRVPIFIFASYFIFNLFAFTVTYFRLMSVSQMVMQVAVENNYLPEEELNTLEAYLDGLESDMLQNAKIVVGVNGDEYLTTDSPQLGTEQDARYKRQYGKEVTCGVSAQYVFIWPLMPKQQISGEFNGIDGTGFGGYLSESELENMRNSAVEDGGSISTNNINLVFTVPGLKYYPDLLNN